MLSRTFGCVRVVWNRTLAARRTRWRAEGKGTSYAETDRALTAMKRDPDLKFLNEVPAVPLQQALRHQQAAFTAFWEKRARYPRFKSRASRQSASYTRAAFRIKDGALYLAKSLLENLGRGWLGGGVLAREAAGHDDDHGPVDVGLVVGG
jgi:putative transposase